MCLNKYISYLISYLIIAKLCVMIMYDTQLYISFKCKDPLESLTQLIMCISDIREWMIKNKLKINDPLLKQNLSDLSVSVGVTQVSRSSNVSDLVVVLNQYLTFHDHNYKARRDKTHQGLETLIIVNTS